MTPKLFANSLALNLIPKTPMLSMYVVGLANIFSEFIEMYYPPLAAAFDIGHTTG